MKENAYNYIAHYVDSLQAKGCYVFSFDELTNTFGQGDNAIRKALMRLSKKGRIVRIREKFYVIVPPEYSRQGVLPPTHFIHELMSFLDKPYYVGLLSAAALHGAAHQQPQSFQVITQKPTTRPINVKNIQIQFFFKSKIPLHGLIKRKTDTGYIQVSNAALTAIDLILFERRIGGWYRIVELLEELLENINVEMLVTVLKNPFPMSVLQRLGYLLAHVFDFPYYEDAVFQVIRNKNYFRVPLDSSKEKSGKSLNQKWKIIENTDWENTL
jgi:predicted transcriptional regulator of viral defense system